MVQYSIASPFALVKVLAHRLEVFCLAKRILCKARRVRKVFGGGMRQAGYLAAAGMYALENNIEPLNTDHKHAKQLLML